MAHGELVHEAVIYDSDEELLAAIVPFLREGAAAGEPTILGCDAERRDLILDALGDATGIEVLDAGSYARPHQAMRSNHELYERLARDAPRIRAVGTVPAADETWDGWGCYEAGMNRLVGHLPVWALCPYDRRTTSDEVLADVRRTHTHLSTPAGAHRPNREFMEPSEFLLRPRSRFRRDGLELGSPHLEIGGRLLPYAPTAVTALAQTTDLDDAAIEGLRRALTEVLRNAIRHGEPPVHVRAWLADDRVVVAVEDAGAGPSDPCIGFASDAGGLRVAYDAAEVSLDYGDERFTVHLAARA